MELAFLLVVLASAALGLMFRRSVNATVRRAALVVGSGALILAVGVLGLLFLAGVAPFGALMSGAVAAVLLAVSAILFPFAVAVSWGQWW